MKKNGKESLIFFYKLQAHIISNTEFGGPN